MPILRITAPLVTHVAITDNIKAKNKYWKINNQAIYSGVLNKFQRAIAIENLHRHITHSLDQSVIDLKISKVKNLKYIFNTVINHGDVKRLSGTIRWKKPEPGYVPRWDINNISDIWIKAGNDALTLNGVIIDDNVGVINETTYKMVEVDDIDDLELEIIITY